MSQRIGPYEIVHRLGEGGMGTVDLARHVETGQTVAIKRLTHFSGPLFDALRREVRSLASIQHPNIVRIFDHDLDGDAPWYAMEFIDGPSLRARLQNRAQPTAIFDSAQTQPFDRTIVSVDLRTLATPPALDQAIVARKSNTSSSGRANDWLELIRSMTDVCAGLSALHAAGIIHRDLKPENILFRETGEAVLVDFGISMLAQGARGRERLTRMLRGSGTPAYLSPEQALSRPLDARADLYSLGVILFEIATGTVPFVHESLIGVLQDHVYTKAPKVGKLNPELPGVLDGLIMRLLSKKPSDRLGFAFDVDLVLRRYFGMNRAGYLPPTYVYAPDLIGREDALQLLSVLVSRIKRRGGGSLLIHGEAGVGKTRLMLEFIQSIAHEIQVHIGFGQQGSQSPFFAFFTVWLSLVEQDPTISEGLPTTYLGWWKEISTGQRPVNYRDVAIAYELIAMVSRNHQRLVILDDVQWLDPWSETLLEHFLKNPPEGLGVILLTRENEPRYLSTTQIELKPLNREQVKEVIKSMVGLDAIADPHVDFAFRESNGNPFILAEMARSAMRERVLFRDQAGVWSFASEKIFQTADVPASEKIIATFEEQLKSLGADLIESLNWCACIGGATDPRLLGKVAPEANPQKLIESSVMYWDGLRLRFKQTMLSRVLYDRMDADDRVQKHLKIAQTLEAIGESNAFVLGRHYFRANANQAAEPYLWRAHQQAERVGILKDSLKFFDFWVRSVTERDATFWSRVLAFLETGKWSLSDLYTQTCLFLMEASQSWDDLEVRSIVRSNYLLGIREETMEVKEYWIESSLRLAEECGTMRARLVALKAARLALHFDVRRSKELQEDILKVAPQVSTVEHISALVDRGRTLLFSTEYAPAREVLQQAQELVEGAELQFNVRYDLISAIAMLESECGNPEIALKMYQDVSTELLRSASDRDIAFYHCSVALFLIALGRYEEALVECERAEVICGYLPFHHIRGLVVLHRVEIAEMLGDISGAHRFFGRGETIFNHPKLEGFRFGQYWRYYRTRFLRRIGDLEGSLKVRPPLGEEPFLDACVLAEQGFMCLERGESVDAIVSRFELLAEEVGFSPTSEPGKLLAALKRAAAASPKQRFRGEYIPDFPAKLLAALQV